MTELTDDEVRREIDRWVAMVATDSSTCGVAASGLHDFFRRRLARVAELEAKLSDPIYLECCALREKAEQENGRLRQIIEDATVPEACGWFLDDLDGAWQASCGMYWTFEAEGPRENNMRFCPGCGKPLAVVEKP